MQFIAQQKVVIVTALFVGRAWFVLATSAWRCAQRTAPSLVLFLYLFWKASCLCFLPHTMDAFLHFLYYYLFDSSVFAKHFVIYLSNIYNAYIIQHVMCPMPCLVLFTFVKFYAKQFVIAAYRFFVVVFSLIKINNESIFCFSLKYIVLCIIVHSKYYVS